MGPRGPARIVSRAGPEPGGRGPLPGHLLLELLHIKAGMYKVLKFLAL